MAPITSYSNESNHQALMDRLDIHGVAKPFRNPAFKTGRRNKNLKQIVSEASRREASQLATQNNSGATTPMPAAGAQASATEDVSMTGTDAAVAESTRTATATGAAAATTTAGGAATLNLPQADSKLSAPPFAGPTITYTNIESAPSLHASSHRKYCDITGLTAPYTDSKSRLRYHNAEMFAIVRTLGQHPIEAYLAARGAHTVLK